MINYFVRADLLVSPSLFVLCSKLILFSLHCKHCVHNSVPCMIRPAPRQEVEGNCTMVAKFIIFVDIVCKIIHFRQDHFIVFFD